MINFHFGSYGAGTPKRNEYAHKVAHTDIAPYAFMARLPQRLLSHPKGGALAFTGQWEQAWGCSSIQKRAEMHRGVFESLLVHLIAGYPVGVAIDRINERYAELVTELSVEFEDIKFGKMPDELELAGLWTATNDARSYMIIGDPAVRLPASTTGVKQP
ncbi:MAG: hypothetical protein D3909_16385 [Candidatus Electrothrix sp. ATG1]|nr:hypothetical protein [Candidatus Electrothrix sp. ATG1]